MKVWEWIALDRLDILALAGLVMLWVGVNGLHSAAAAWAACGVVLVAFSLIGALRRGRE